MEVKFNAGDMCTIPDGCKAIVKDGSVVIEKEGQEFENGDILCSKNNTLLLIFKEAYEYNRGRFDSYYNSEHWDNKGWNSAAFRHATEEEKQLLFDKMKEQGLKWNAEEKRVEKVRWRASFDERYYYINHLLDCHSDIEDSHIFNKERWKMGNYFKNKEQAEEAAKRVKETLRNYHEEIGE